jgi:predicted transcriptional regulator
MSLAKYMDDNKVSDGKLAAQLEVSRPYVTRLRHGLRQPSLKVASKLETITGIPAVQFLNPAVKSRGKAA